MKRFGRLIIGILLVAGSIGFLFFFEFYLKDKIDTVEVVVAKESIDFKQQITADDLMIKAVRRGNEVEGAMTPLRMETLIGKHASIAIKKGTQIYPELIDTYDLVPDDTKGEFVAPIPKDWLFAVPGSLRRTYFADIYVIGDKDAMMVKQLEQDAQNASSSIEVVETDENVDGEVIETDQTPDSLRILENIKVASVKDGSNKEVTQSTETNEATGSVVALEIIANEEIFETIKDYTENGYKLYVVYKFDRGDTNE